MVFVLLLVDWPLPLGRMPVWHGKQTTCCATNGTVIFYCKEHTCTPGEGSVARRGPPGVWPGVGIRYSCIPLDTVLMYPAGYCPTASLLWVWPPCCPLATGIYQSFLVFFIVFQRPLRDDRHDWHGAPTARRSQWARSPSGTCRGHLIFRTARGPDLDLEHARRYVLGLSHGSLHGTTVPLGKADLPLSKALIQAGHLPVGLMAWCPVWALNMPHNFLNTYLFGQSEVSLHANMCNKAYLCLDLASA